jgi:ketosteroid isomerase-like protein
MSEQNVEIVRRIYDEWGRGNFRAGTELYDPDALLILRPEFPESGTYRGLSEIQRYMTEGFLRSWRDLVIEGEEFLEAGDSVVVRVHQRGIGRKSDAPVEMRYFQVWTFRGRTVIRIEAIRERSEALQAVGLQE